MRAPQFEIRDPRGAASESRVFVFVSLVRTGHRTRNSGEAVLRRLGSAGGLAEDRGASKCTV